jgi:Anaphase-promoting complex, subunit 10 (APC10)
MTNSSSSAASGAKPALDVGHDLREIGHLAVWTVTSAKPGNGVELLRDGNKDTYWQSDGTQPHLVDIQFQKKMHIKARSWLHAFKQGTSSARLPKNSIDDSHAGASSVFGLSAWRILHAQVNIRPCR